MTPVAATYTERVLFLRGKFSLLAALATAFVLTGLCLTTTTTSSAAAPSTVYAETSDQVVTTRAAKRWPGKRITYTDYTARLAPPGAGHLFGTDNLGRDIFSRVIWGAQI